MRLPIIIGIGLLMSLGLNAPVMSQLNPQVEPLPAIADSDLLEQFRLYSMNRRLWNQQRIRNYRYTLSNSCFCIPEARGPVIIEVRNGMTVSITSKETGQPVNPEFFQQYDTIPRLFNVIRNAIARRADNLDVKYDSKLGYPTQINIDYSFQIADEEVFLTIENLEVLP